MAHILIIEDDRAIARIEKDYLEMSGFSVTLAEDGETGCRTMIDIAPAYLRRESADELRRSLL